MPLQAFSNRIAKKKALADFLEHPANPERGVNSQSVNAGIEVLNTREKIARFFNFDKSERVVFTSGITESLNLCISSLFNEKTHVITSFLEHNSVLRPLYKQNCDISFSDGTLNDIKRFLRPNTKAVIISHASNVTGEIQDIKEIGKWTNENGLLFIVDSAQSAGTVKVDVREYNIDFLTFSAYKGLLGIQGLGGIIVNNYEHPLRPLKVGGTGIKSFLKEQPDAYPNFLEAGTQNIPAIIGLGAAIDYINERGCDNILKHECKLKNMLLMYLQKKNNIEIYQNSDKESTAVVSFNVKGTDCARVSSYLDSKYNIIVRTGAHCAPLVMKHFGITNCVRVNFGLNNSETDVETLIEAIHNIALRQNRII